MTPCHKMTRLALVALCAAAAAASAAAQPPAQPSARYKDYYHSYTLRQQLESQESFSGRGAGAGGQRGLPTGPSGPAAPGTAPAVAASAPAATEVPPATATPAPALKPTAEALPSVQLADAHQRASNTRGLPVYYHAYPYYGYGGWPVMAPAAMSQPAWGLEAQTFPRVAGVVAGHHGGHFLHPGLYGAHYGGGIVGHHGLVAHHGGNHKGHHGGLFKGHHGGLVKGHHGGLVKGHHGLAAHHGGFIKTPLGLIATHGGGLLLHAKDATGGQPAEEGADQQVLVQVPLYSVRSAVPQQFQGYHAYHPHYLGWKSPALAGHGKKAGGAASGPLPVMPGKIKGGADVALFNAHGHGSQKGLQGATAHKYKHYNLDVGYGCPPAARPLHLMHTDAGFDVSQYTVGGAASAEANVAHGLGGTFGLL